MFSDIATPTLILDAARVRANTRAMAERMHDHGVALRPHLKTAKCVEVARLATAGHFGGITVSTLAEAVFFARHGFDDITWAVAMVPAKLEAAACVRRLGAQLNLIVDSVEVATQLAEGVLATGVDFGVLVEIDTGDHRTGVTPESAVLVEVARVIAAAANLRLLGVLTHAGQVYDCRDCGEAAGVAELERAGVVAAAERLRVAGLPCPVVSAGSTPTAACGQRFDGITEMRPGNYVFYDLFQHGLGVCAPDDIAVSVLATVIGRADDRVVIDAGALALSKDVGAQRLLPDAGYGWVVDADSGERIGVSGERSRSGARLCHLGTGAARPPDRLPGARSSQPFVYDGGGVPPVRGRGRRPDQRVVTGERLVRPFFSPPPRCKPS